MACFNDVKSGRLEFIITGHVRLVEFTAYLKQSM